MTCFQNRLRNALIVAVVLTVFSSIVSTREYSLPPFGRHTVLVWKVKIANLESEFVVRIAEFSPDRFVEWEASNLQGTVFMPFQDIEKAKGYVNRSLFEGGVDKKSHNNTTLWLSRRIYRELKAGGKSKCLLDGVAGALQYRGQGSITVEVNRVPRELPVIEASDGRGSEFWFLDLEENPLMAKQVIRHYSQTLAAITTDRLNTLRWIKGEKLAHPPRSLSE